MKDFALLDQLDFEEKEFDKWAEEQIAIQTQEDGEIAYEV